MQDYRGARGANAGDDYHELWALRTAMALLDSGTNMHAMTVEGLTLEDESGVLASTWDGVDCACFYGGDSLESAERIEIVQVKYSAANPDQEWNVTWLTHATNKLKTNSVIGRMAQAFTGIYTKQPDVITQGRCVIKLISNQPIAHGIIETLTDKHPEHRDARAKLQAASGLSDDAFAEFARCLDLSSCGTQSRFALEEDVLSTIAGWTDIDAQHTANTLKRSIHQKMLPESKGEIINQQTILSWMGVSNESSLFPCPSAITPVAHPVPRAISHEIVEMLQHGHRLCLHGEGGCGKTTILQEIATLLPPQSIMQVFDCYGGGSYLDTDACATARTMPSCT